MTANTGGCKMTVVAGHIFTTYKLARVGSKNDYTILGKFNFNLRCAHRIFVS